LGHLEREIERLAVAALARAAAGERGQAHELLEAALEAAAPDAYRRVLVDGADAMAALLRAHVRRGTAQPAFAEELIARLEAEPSATPAHEALRARELAVLRLLATLRSNEEIAGELGISGNTLKTHVRHLYAKLGAADRREAVATGRRLRLL